MGDFKGQVGREKGRSRMTPAYLYGVLNYLFKLTFSVVQFLGQAITPINEQQEGIS